MKVPEQYKCFLCKGLLRDAVLAACCGHSFCIECYQQQLLANPLEQCPGPDCSQQISADSLIPNKSLLAAIQKYLNELQTGASAAATNIPASITQPPPSKPPPIFIGLKNTSDPATSTTLNVTTQDTSSYVTAFALSSQPASINNIPTASTASSLQGAPLFLPQIPIFDPKRPPSPINIPISAAQNVPITPPIISSSTHVTAENGSVNKKELSSVWENFLKRKDKDSAAKSIVAAASSGQTASGYPSLPSMSSASSDAPPGIGQDHSSIIGYSISSDLLANIGGRQYKKRYSISPERRTPSPQDQFSRRSSRAVGDNYRRSKPYFNPCQHALAFFFVSEGQSSTILYKNNLMDKNNLMNKKPDCNEILEKWRLLHEVGSTPLFKIRSSSELPLPPTRRDGNWTEAELSDSEDDDTDADWLPSKQTKRRRLNIEKENNNEEENENNNLNKLNGNEENLNNNEEENEENLNNNEEENEENLNNNEEENEENLNNNEEEENNNNEEEENENSFIIINLNNELENNYEQDELVIMDEEEETMEQSVIYIIII
uniref:RING-type domain-containing protein n=1 Tax=Meloidogyne javanica TaxID=6303 RepID=A0A915LFU8_MELJA